MPDWGREVRERLSSLGLSPTREAEIVEEVSQHLEDRFRELTAAGASADDAARGALADFDADRLARHLSPLRQANVPPAIPAGAPAVHWLGDLGRDLRYALRTLGARPGFTSIAVLSLALGIGANTAIFSLWNGVLHSQLPEVRDAGGLVMLTSPDDSGSWTGRVEGVRKWLTYEEFEELRDHAEGFSGLMASQSSLGTWTVRFEADAPEEASGRLVSGGFFDVLGVSPAIGRVFTAEDDRSATPHAVLSHGYWQRRLGGRPDVLGRTLTIRQTAFSIVGVAPRGFVGETSGQQPDLWLPLRMQPHVLPDRDRLHDTPPDKAMWLHVFGRLEPGVTLAQAEARANAVFRSGLESFYGAGFSSDPRRDFLDQRLQIRPAAGGASRARSAFSQSLTALLGAVGVLLLIACANLANLLLARGTARTPELALRLSLGASRGRLVRQLVTESLVLAAMGTLVALAVAFVLHGALVRMIAESDPHFRLAFRLDPAALAFVAAVAVLATLLFGVFPAWQVTRIDVEAALREQGRGAVGGPGLLRSCRFLVSLQLALSLPLLVGAGLLARTVHNLGRADLGFPVERLLLVRVDLREAGYEGARRAGVLRELLGEIQRIPGVRATSFSQLGLFTGGESTRTIDVEGHAAKGQDDRDSGRDAVGPDYFATLGAPLLLGRGVQDGDGAGAPRICVVNEAFVRRFFEGRNPLGRRITEVADQEAPGEASDCQVVGVAGDARTQGLRGDVAPRYFVAAAQSATLFGSPTLLVRTSAEPEPMMRAVRRTIQRVDASVPILKATTLDEQMSLQTAQDRTTARLVVVFGSTALALAAIGL
ncbi:MAG TPA: ADOP family duplicated permease, partial [Vicinamibacteria bacterium]